MALHILFQKLKGLLDDEPKVGRKFRWKCLKKRKATNATIIKFVEVTCFQLNHKLFCV